MAVFLEGGGGAAGFSADEILSTSTAALFGLDESATPDDVFSAIKALINSTDSELSSEITALANSASKIQTGSYTGTGTYGSSNPCKLTFSFTPKYFAIYAESTLFVNMLQDGTYTSSTPDYEYIGNQNCKNNSANSVYATFSINGNTLSWYARGSSVNISIDAGHQCNYADHEYRWIALG